MIGIMKIKILTLLMAVSSAVTFWASITNRQKGALNNESDPDYIKRSKHAKLYYEEIINSNREIIIKKLSEAVRINIKSAKKVYEHVLINEYDLADGHHSVYSFYV